MPKPPLQNLRLPSSGDATRKPAHEGGIKDMEQRLHSRLLIIDDKLEKLVFEVMLFQNSYRSAPSLGSEKMVYEPKLLEEGSPSRLPLVGIREVSLTSTENRVTEHPRNSRASRGTKESRIQKDKEMEALYDRVSARCSKVSSPSVTSDIWERIVNDSHFDALCALVVLLNSLLVGVQINHDATNDHEEKVYNIIEYVCTAFFSIELFIRILARKQNFFAKAERTWAVFDVVLVLMSWIDIGMELVFQASGGIPGPGASMGKMLKMARMARIMRILRMVRWLSRIRIMASLIVGSMVSLFWLMVLLLTVMYIFAIVLTQGATMWLKPGEGFEPPVSDPNYSIVKFYYGNVFRSIYTLFMAMTGGVSWGEPGDVTQTYGWVYFVVFISYIFFAIFSVMNIVTGVFVDGAIQQAENDRSMMLEKQKEQKLEMSRALEEILEALDKDKNGFLTREEWAGMFTNANIQATLASMQIDIHEAEDLYELLDVDEDGEVSIREFIDGMIRLKGWAKAIDMERLNARVARVHRVTERMFEQVGSLLLNSTSRMSLQQSRERLESDPPRG